MVSAVFLLALLPFGVIAMEEPDIPIIDPKIVPQSVAAPEIFPAQENDALNRPMPLPMQPPKPFPQDTGPAARAFPSDPPMRRPPQFTDSSNNWPVLSSAMKGSQPPARWMHTAVTIGDELLIWGGIATEAAALNDLWMYSYKDAEWTEMERPMAPSLPAYPNPGQNQGDMDSLAAAAQRPCP